MIKQNSHLTYKGNKGVTRHDWLRLTPAYSYGLVSAAVDGADSEIRVLDPFAGTGTTGLVAAERGMRAWLLDLNPFLVWFARMKTRNYTLREIETTQRRARRAIELANENETRDVWVPPMFKIARWWHHDSLMALGRLRKALGRLALGAPVDDLLALAFCRVMITTSNAAFNHQSMSFKSSGPQLKLFGAGELQNILGAFSGELDAILSSATVALPGHASAELDDSRHMSLMPTASVDLIYTSPPYANRISYIRELRPYMYWLGFLIDAKEAGELDWAAIGGTWGIATSRLTTWTASPHPPLGDDFQTRLDKIAGSDGSHAASLSTYVAKYFFDIYEHLKAAYRVIAPGGRAIYIVGNSTFYGTTIPTEQWYGDLLSAAGFNDVNITTLRKRNSKRELFEYQVAATRP